MAAFCGLRYPNVFGNVLSQSGSFGYRRGDAELHDEEVSLTTWGQLYLAFGEAERGWLVRQFLQSRKLPLRLYLEVGKYEGNNPDDNRHFRDVLLPKGYPVVYSEYFGGHDYLTWRNSIGDGLIALLGK